jgi:hypothetical protein
MTAPASLRLPSPRRAPAHALLLVTLLSSTGCPKRPPPTANGTLLVGWARTGVGWASGLSTGADVGPHTSVDHIVVFTPDSPRDKSLRAVQLKLHVETTTVALNPAPGGGRPAETVSTPAHIDLTVFDNGGWQITGHCTDPISSPAEGTAKGTVTVRQECTVQVVSGSDGGAVSIIAIGDGRIDLVGQLGRAQMM